MPKLGAHTTLEAVALTRHVLDEDLCNGSCVLSEARDATNRRQTWRAAGGSSRSDI